MLTKTVNKVMMLQVKNYTSLVHTQLQNYTVTICAWLCGLLSDPKINKQVQLGG